MCRSLSVVVSCTLRCNHDSLLDSISDCISTGYFISDFRVCGEGGGKGYTVKDIEYIDMLRAYKDLCN